jgi:hypothetical protein
MNDHILDIAVASQLISADYNGFDRTAMSAAEKRFAEMLIVKCANIIWDEADKKDNAEINEGGYKILDHFGIDWRAEQTEETFGVEE